MPTLYADIPDFDNYQISNEGDIWSTKRGTRTHVAGMLCPNGYRYFRFQDNGRSRMDTIHRLVATAFLPPPLEGQTQIDHIDRNKLNNAASNLRWVTPSENLVNRAVHDHPLLYIHPFNCRNTSRWKVQIPTTGTGTAIHIGLFTTVEDAIGARDAFLRDGTRPPPKKTLPVGVTVVKGRYKATYRGTYLGQWATLDEAVAARNLATEEQ